MLQQDGVIFSLASWCHTSLTGLMTNWMWNLSVHLDMCLLMYVAALYNHISYCIIRAVN